MDGERFDDLLTRITAARLTRLEALRGVVAGVAATGLGLGSAAGEAEGTKGKKGGKGKGKHRKGQGKGKGQAERQPKVTLCHKPGMPAEKTISVGAPAVPAHLGHGDTEGPCEDGGGGGNGGGGGTPGLICCTYECAFQQIRRGCRRNDGRPLEIVCPQQIRFVDRNFGLCTRTGAQEIASCQDCPDPLGA